MGGFEKYAREMSRIELLERYWKYLSEDEKLLILNQSKKREP
tara:strand:- start:298 stop:423 length:126 start_codon:yes stop_codon:yes gene_type:complete